MSFRMGDSVKVRQGVRDPDFDADLSCWQGRIVERIDAQHVCIEWDSYTLQNMSHSQIKACERQGWGWRSIHLELSDIEKASPNDTQEQVEETVEKLEEQFFWAHLGVQGDRVGTVLSGISLDDEVGALKTWANYLNNTVTFPLPATVTEIQFTGSLQSGDLVTVHGIMENYSQGLSVVVESNANQYYFPLSDLEVHDKESEFFSPVEDYVIWFSNR
jgi:hypothetical protein